MTGAFTGPTVTGLNDINRRCGVATVVGDVQAASHYDCHRLRRRDHAAIVSTVIDIDATVVTNAIDTKAITPASVEAT